MKFKSRFISLFSAALMVTAGTALLQAEDVAPAAPAAPSASAAPAAPAKAKAKAAAKALAEKGAIDALDATAKTITVNGKAFKVADTAKVMIDGVAKQLADLQIKDMVVVGFKTEADGSMTAIKIAKGVAPKAPKKK